MLFKIVETSYRLPGYALIWSLRVILAERTSLMYIRKAHTILVWNSIVQKLCQILRQMVIEIHKVSPSGGPVVQLSARTTLQ